ncbi:MAG: 50S ribosomal protein L11 methyltransferase [Alphaproteobacteria bacterium]|nr:50S ribosomal protein L11 methyltransferase [Alphaproteobacteria bacterium]
MPAWKIAVTIPAPAAMAFDGALSDALVEHGLVVSTVETTRDGPWRSEVYGEADDASGPDSATRTLLGEAITAAAAQAGIAAPAWDVEVLPDTDWVAENQRSFQPFRVGRFWVHPSHAADPVPERAIPLRIDAGLAFGTGTHATTRGCLEAIGALDPAAIANPVDVGTGSGILAIAMALAWRRGILGGDNDPDSITVARENAVLNGVADHCDFHLSEGLSAPPLASRGPYDLIVANILAGPLVGLAPSFAAAAAARATLILSGLLVEQVDEVLAAYRAQGFALVRGIDHEAGGADWRTLVLSR